MNGYLVGVAFWVFVAVSAVAGIVGDYKKRKLALEPLRAAIERGQPLDPKVVEQLMKSDREAEEVQPHTLRMAGVITCASGVGVALASFFIAQIARGALFPMLAIGVIAVCVGVGLLLSAQVMQQARAERYVRERDVRTGGDSQQ